MCNFESSLEKRGLLPRVWWRYVDDVFAVIKVNEAESILSVLNSQYPSIKFTIEIEKDGRLPFLDVMVQRRDAVIEFDVYRKPTNVPRYIPADSHCPRSHKHAAFNSMVYRLCKLPLKAVNYMKELDYKRSSNVEWLRL